MSEGPIKQWRDSFKVPPVSTNPKTAMHFWGAGHAYCGRRNVSNYTTGWDDVTCADCKAAKQADERPSI